MAEYVQVVPLESIEPEPSSISAADDPAPEHTESAPVDDTVTEPVTESTTEQEETMVEEIPPPEPSSPPPHEPVAKRKPGRPRKAEPAPPKAPAKQRGRPPKQTREEEARPPPTAPQSLQQESPDDASLLMYLLNQKQRVRKEREDLYRSFVANM